MLVKKKISAFFVVPFSKKILRIESPLYIYELKNYKYHNNMGGDLAKSVI